MKLIPYIIIVILTAGISFFGGMQYQRYSLRGNFNRQFGANGQLNRGQGNMSNFRPVIGEVTASDSASLTVKSQDGSSKIVILSGSTTISKTESGSLTDVKVGDRIAVIGTANTDGSVTAQNIQLNPQYQLRGENTNNPR